MLRLLKIFESRVLLLGVAAIGALWAFLSLAGEVTEGETLGVDRKLLLMLRMPGDTRQPIGSQSFQEAMRDVTALGGIVFLTLLVTVAVLAFLLHRKRLHAMVLAGAVLVSVVGSEVLKTLYGRPRPVLVPHGSYVYSSSFPSGHSMHSAVTYLTLAMLICTLETRRATKVLAFSVAILLLLSVGISRVYLGVHWPSDVLGGWCLGAAVALAAWGVLLKLGVKPAREER
jgi:undecaprenyl-diphosphatase